MWSKLSDKQSFMVAGYVARDAEVKPTKTGKTLTRWSVAAAKTKKEDGSFETMWTNCQAWHDTARAAASIRKGDTVLCIGRLETSEYEGKTYKNLIVEFFCKMPTGTEPVFPAVPSVAGSTKKNDNPDNSLGDFEEIISDGEVPF